MRFLQDLLRSFGYEVWVDTSNIPGGAKWAVEIENAIRQSESLAVIVTPSSIESEWVNREIGLAIEHEKTVVPIILEGDVPSKLSDYQWVDISIALDELRKAFPARTELTMIRSLQDQLQDINPDSRLEALGTIEALMAAERPVPPHLLLNCLNDPMPQVRQEAARALGGLNADWALDELIGCLTDEHRDVRIWAAWALGKIGDSRAKQSLLELQENESDPRVLRWISRALGKMT